MKFEIAFSALVLSIACLSADAYAPASLVSRPSTAFVTSRIPKATSSQLFSQWDEDEEEEPVAVGSAPSYEEAGKQIGEEDDQAALDEVGDFDASGNYNANDVDKYREAIQKRTEALGIERKTPEEIAAEEAMALAALDRAGETMGPPTDSKSAEQLSQMLDLSQITSDAPRGADESLPAMMYDPADDMTEEEMAEADPIGLKPWNEQLAWVFSKAQFPSALDALGETLILAATVTITGFTVANWDVLMKEIAFNYQGVPRADEVAGAMEGMEVPTLSGADMLKMLQEGSQQFTDAVKDGSIVDLLSENIPQDL